MTERSRSGAVFVVTAYLIAIRLVTATGMRPIRSVLAPAGNLLTHTCIASHDDTSLAGARPLAKQSLAEYPPVRKNGFTGALELNQPINN